MDAGLPSQKPERQKTAGKPAEQSGDSSNEKPKAEIAVARPPGDVPPSPPNSTKPCNDGQNPHREIPNWVEKTLLFVEILGLIGLAYYCWINKRELNVFDSERVTMENEFSSTQTLNQRQLKAAQDQVDMMRGQLKESQSARFFDERAWIFPSKVSIEKTDDVNGDAFFKVAFKNSGKTPATHISTFIDIINNPEVDFKTDAAGHPADSDVTITPDGTGSVDTYPMSPGFFESITNGSQNCVFGTIWYDDVFGIHHWTQFCYLVRKDLSLSATKNHNGCDDQAD